MKILKLALTFSAALLLAGCFSTAPIDEPTVQAPSGSTAEDIKKAVMYAGVEYGWEMTEAGPGHINGVLNIRRHRAEIDVEYDDTTFTIRYKDSTNLKYNGSTIHRRYNTWVKNLRIKATQYLINPGKAGGK